MDAVTACSLRRTCAHRASAFFHVIGRRGHCRQRDLLIALDQVIDDALGVRQLVGRLLLHPLGKTRQVVGGQPDRHRQVLVSGAELEFEVLVQTFEQLSVHDGQSIKDRDSKPASGTPAVSPLLRVSLEPEDVGAAFADVGRCRPIRPVDVEEGRQPRVQQVLARVELGVAAHRALQLHAPDRTRCGFGVSHWSSRTVRWSAFAPGLRHVGPTVLPSVRRTRASAPYSFLNPSTIPAEWTPTARDPSASSMYM